MVELDSKLATMYDHALTAKGCYGLSAVDLCLLAGYAAARRAVVHTVEAFIFENGKEIAAPEYSLFGPFTGPSRALTRLDIESQIDSIKELAQALREVERDVRFQVWLSDELDI